MDDLELVVELARSFHQYSLWKDTVFDEDQVRAMATSLVLNGGVFVNDMGGFIAGAIIPLHFSPDFGVATELAWYAPNGGGRELRESFETWAKQNGASIVQFSALADEKFDEVHRKMSAAGYALAELQYVKVI